jgi:hypothetical protein
VVREDLSTSEPLAELERGEMTVDSGFERDGCRHILLGSGAETLVASGTGWCGHDRSR